MYRFIIPIVLSCVAAAVMAKRGINMLTLDYWLIYFTLFNSGYILASSEKQQNEEK